MEGDEADIFFDSREQALNKKDIRDANVSHVVIEDGTRPSCVERF